ncbi:lasso peptide biosynthesis B2 protein [Actinophytocola sp.]|uniref:lasso peptide biosynthesis B2 protein n=1 Tax=Actinophytocola sp. TaxID=1872138 RepID=UPI00389A0E08
MTSFVIPDGVRAVPESDGRMVLLNENTGVWHSLNRAGADLYQTLGSSGDIDDAVDRLVQRHRDVPPDRIRGDVERVITELVRRGLLQSTGTYTRYPAAVLMATPDAPGAVPQRHRVVAGVAFVVALVLLRLPFRTSTTLVSTLKRRLATRDATLAEAAHLLATATFVTRHHPGRVACLELSLTAVLTAALLRRRIDWCFGFATDPQTFHSWIEVTGTPVTAVTDDPILPTYTRVTRV